MAIRQILAHRRLWLALIPLALAVTVPAWRLGFLADDYIHAAKITEPDPLRVFSPAGTPTLGAASRGLFHWFGPELKPQTRAWGTLPWWIAPDAKQAFWRPLSAATHWLDYRLWPARPVYMHVHSALWFCALVLIVWIVYRSFPGKLWAAGLAALLFAINQENYQTFAWIAARNPLIAAFCMALAVGLYHRHVQRASPVCVVGAALALAAGLLAGEGAVATLAYIASYTVTLDQRPWRSRLASLIPLGLVFVIWRLAYQALGFGVAHSGLYVDPGSSPARYLVNLFEWAPLLVLDVLTSPILGKYAALAPAAQPWALGAGSAVLAVLGWVLYPLLKADRASRFWALGGVMAVVPACATTVPEDRATLYAAIGLFPLVTAYVAGLLEGDAWVPTRRPLRLAMLATGVFFLMAHILQPLPGHAKRFVKCLRVAPPAGPLIPLTLHADPSQELIVINPPDVMWLSYYPFLRNAEKQPLPLSLRTLSSALGDVDVWRTDSNSLSMASASGPLIPTALRAASMPAHAPLQDALYRLRRIATAFRNQENAFAIGQTVTLPGVTVTVTRVDSEGMPTEAHFMFAHDLENARYRWVMWDARQAAFLPFTPPPKGATLRLPGPLTLAP